MLLEILESIFNDKKSLKPLAYAKFVERMASMIPDISHMIDQDMSLRDFMSACAERIIAELPKYEKRYRIRLGNHTILTMGIFLGRRDFPRRRNTIYELFRYLGLREWEEAILILRPHTITALHDEHKSQSISITPGIIRIGTLNTGIYQVTREEALAMTENMTDL